MNNWIKNESLVGLVIKINWYLLKKNTADKNSTESTRDIRK